jgi:Sulfatase
MTIRINPDERDDTTPDQPPPGRLTRLRSLAGSQLVLFLELFALAGLVVAQPLLEVLGDAPDFLLFRQADGRDIVALAVAIVLLPPLALWALDLLAGLLGRRAQAAVHLVLVAGLLGLLGLLVAKKLTPLLGVALAAAGVLAAVAGGLLYTRAPAFRLWLRYLSPAPLVFVLLFLLASPAASLLKAPPAPVAAAPGAAPRGQDSPIVMVLMDEFPLGTLLDQRGNIDRRLYPNFATLAKQSTWYRNSTAVIGMTGWALPSMMTGRYPAEDRLPVASQYPDNLFTLLGGSYGYKMRVFEGMSQLCPPATCHDAKKSNLGVAAGGGQVTGEQGGFRGVLGDSARLWTQMVSTQEVTANAEATLQEATVDADAEAAGPDKTADPERRAQVVKGYKRGVNFQRFLTSIRAPRPGQRSMYFVHVLVPHQPWKALPSGRTYPQRDFGEPFATGGHWVAESWPVENIHHRHMLQAAIADRMVGDLIKKLRATGMFDRSLLVVTADHGLAFHPGRNARANPDEAGAPDALWVPTFIKHPGQRSPTVTDVNWEHVDLLPTIADIMGLTVPWKTDGVSWADPEAANRRPRSEKWFYSSPGVRKVFQGPSNQSIALRGVTDRLLHPQDGYLGWFKFGPHADLVGQRVADLPVAAGGGTARVSGLTEYRQVDPDSGQVPAWVAGQLTSTAQGVADRPVVVAAINGVVGGVSKTFSSAGSDPTWFSAMVPDSLMRRGDNQLQLFLVDTGGGQRRLRPLTLTG